MHAFVLTCLMVMSPSGMASDIISKPAEVVSIYDRSMMLADQPTFDFPISTALGVAIEHPFSPPPADAGERLFLLLAASPS